MRGRKLLLGCCLLTVAAWNIRGADAAVFDPSKSYQTIKTAHFSIHYTKELDHVAHRVADISEEVFDILTPRYRWKPWGRTQMVLTDNNDLANGAASVLPYNWLLIRVTGPDAESPLNTYDDWLRTLIMHEYTHILHMDQVGGVMRVPRLLLGKLTAPNGIQTSWMREGLAVYEETRETTGGRGRASFSKMMLRTDALNDTLLKIDQADGQGWRWPAANAQYIYGIEFLQWLSKNYGDEKLLAYPRQVGRNPFFLADRHNARKVWGKTLPKLWKDWQTELRSQYAAERTTIEARGLTALTMISDTGASLSAPVYSPDGSRLAYTMADYHDHPQILVKDLATGKETVVRKKQIATQISFAPTGDQIVYSAVGVSKKFNNFYDIYLLNLETNKLKRLTSGQRAFDPDFSPDGKKLVYVVNDAGTQHLMVHDLATQLTTLIPVAAPEFTQYAHPRWAPDGKTIAVSSWREGGFRDIFLVRPDGTVVKQLTHDRAIDLSPTWSRDGRQLYFSSDRTGITNVYRYDVKQGKLAQVTNVLTGAFEPTIAPDGKTMVVQHYTGKGYDLRSVDLTAADRISHIVYRQDNQSTEVTNHEPQTTSHATDVAPLAAKKYSPFTGSLFVPRFLAPNVAALDNGVMVSAVTGGADPLRWHNWFAGGTYRTDANYFGYFGSYFYNRFLPMFDLGINNYAVNFGNLTFLHADGTLRTVHIYEKRLRGSAGITYPWKQHRFSLQYFIEDRDNLPALTTEERAALNLDRFAGFSTTYRFGTAERFPASISTEKGRRLRMNFTMTDRRLGSNRGNEQKIFAGDYREYISLPWRHHVLATRIAGGITWGDRLVQGTFGMGGALGEGALAGGESFYYFPLRGLPVSTLSRTRALLASMEYRIPLGSPQRGIGTRPFFLNNIHAAFFADYGNAWNAGESTGRNFFGRFFLGTGAELRGDFILGHGLPVTGRLGYGVIVLNRQRLGTLADPLFSNPVKYGTAILQFGTAF